MLEVAVSLLIAACGWLVWNTLKAREAANSAIRSACDRAGFLFLDDTVALHTMWPVRNDAGHLTLRRVYRFAYSDTGHDRRQGSVSLVATRVVDVDLGQPAPSDAARPQ